MYYKAIDRWNASDSLSHYKYVKKIKIGPFTRYFYSMKDLQAYYDATKKVRNKELNNEYTKGEIRMKTLDQANNSLNHISAGSKEKKQARKNIAKAWHHNNRAQIKIAADQLTTPVHSVMETGKFAIKNIFGSKSKKEAKRKELNSYNNYKQKQVSNSRKRQKKLSTKTLRYLKNGLSRER